MFPTRIFFPKNKKSFIEESKFITLFYVLALTWNYINDSELVLHRQHYVKEPPSAAIISGTLHSAISEFCNVLCSLHLICLFHIHQQISLPSASLYVRFCRFPFYANSYWSPWYISKTLMDVWKQSFTLYIMLQMLVS